MSKLQQITEGWVNNLTPSQFLDPQITEVANERISICEKCEFHSKNHLSIRLDAHCTHCGCTLSAKTKCLTCECPIKKWAAITNTDENN